MNPHVKQSRTPLHQAWFGLTPSERWFVAAVLAIVLIGLIARYFHLKNQSAAPYDPDELNAYITEIQNER
jgi:hypothetical protein